MLHRHSERRRGGPVEGAGGVIDHCPAASGLYVGSPSLALLADGAYVASHDLFGPRSNENVRATTRVFRSADKGKTWARIAEIQGQFWSSLFVHNGALYVLGTWSQYGHVVVRRSTDGGKTWTEPKDAGSGLILADGRYHCAPVPVVVHNGRLWRGMEDAFGPGGWGKHFRAFMMSAPADADLLKAESWTCSNRIARDPKWLGGKFGGWLEGNAVVTRDGRLVDILRVESPLDDEKAAIVEISPDGKAATFDPQRGFVSFPGGAKKFTIRFDAPSGLYWSLANHVPPKHRRGRPNQTRNTLALISSPDLKAWTVRSILIEHPDPVKHGFQYLDWQFEGDDIVAVSRTAYHDGLGGAHNHHDANFMTFHRIANFRTLKGGAE
ncbi:MAG: exo-alpha-sialidase [Planctomycetes bacterium]|nr:exo-alpha-sialidase [Planctomycetota bacterium]